MPHGEANYQFPTAVFKRYSEKRPEGTIQELNAILASRLGAEQDDAYGGLERLLDHLIDRKRLSAYGMKHEEIGLFADSVLEKQGRLLANNYVELSRDEIRDIYRSLF